jgi:hypothetical protein
MFGPHLRIKNEREMNVGPNRAFKEEPLDQIFISS